MLKKPKHTRFGQFRCFGRDLGASCGLGEFCLESTLDSAVGKLSLKYTLEARIVHSAVNGFCWDIRSEA